MKNKLIIYYAGNPLLEQDALPFKIVPELEKIFPEITFKHHDPNENLPEHHKNIVIIDTVINTKQVITITDSQQLATDNIYSPHDWDLAFNLKLLLKLKKINNFFIIGIPPKGNVQKIIEAIKNIIYNQLTFKK